MKPYRFASAKSKVQESSLMPFSHNDNSFPKKPDECFLRVAHLVELSPTPLWPVYSRSPHHL